MVRRTSRYGNGYASTAVQGALTLGRPSEKARGLKLNHPEAVALIVAPLLM